VNRFIQHAKRIGRRSPSVGVFFVLLITAGAALAAGMAAPDRPQGGYTQADVVLLTFYVLMALGFSFLCSIAEAVLLSITPSFIAGLQDSRPKQAALLKQLKQENVDRSLAAILTLNTIAHTVGAIGSGAKATVVFGSAYFGIFSAIMTLMILFLSEIIPKTLGAVYWRALAGFSAHVVRLLIYLLYPLILVSERLTKWIARGKKVHAFSRDEFIAMTRIGEQTGHIKKEESRIIRNLLRFESLTARDIMTPRPVIVAVNENKTVAEAMAEAAETPFSRLPVYGKNRDDITGFVLKDELLLSQARGEADVELNVLKRNITIVLPQMPLSTLLEYLLDSRSHIALVVGEYGGTEGLVTLEDVVETLLGMEIMDELDTTADMRALARRQWQKRAKSLGLQIDGE